MEIPAAVGRVLSKLEPNTRGSIRAAERQARDEIQDGDTGPVRCALARVMLEDWRNGWDELAEPNERKAALRKALEALDLSARRRDKTHWYVDWKRGYILRYTARALDRPDDRTAAIAFYHSAYDKLSAYTGLPPKRGEKALRSLVVDWAETLVYLDDVSTALQYFDFTLPWRRRVPDDWHEWAHAFALHQNGDYAASWRKLEPIVAQLDNPNAEAAVAQSRTLIAPKRRKIVHTHYYNDMRLVLAASYARDGKTEEAKQQIEKFQLMRRLASEQPWTRAMEADRGAFAKGSPGEKHWIRSLELAGLAKGETPPSDKGYAVAATGRGAPTAPSKGRPSAAKRKTAKKPASKKTTTKKKPAAKKATGSKRKAKMRSKAKTKRKAGKTRAKTKSRGSAKVRHTRKSKSKPKTGTKTRRGRKATVKKAAKSKTKRKTGGKVRRTRRAKVRGKR